MLKVHGNVCNKEKVMNDIAAEHNTTLKDHTSGLAGLMMYAF